MAGNIIHEMKDLKNHNIMKLDVVISEQYILIAHIPISTIFIFLTQEVYILDFQEITENLYK